LYESVILSLGIVILFFYAKHVQFYWWEWCELPGNVLILSMLKLDRMSLFSADLLRSGFLSLQVGIYYGCQ
jgi:hypothetical protein